jgi:transcriptional regulator with XRE-family HTH domain
MTAVNGIDRLSALARRHRQEAGLTQEELARRSGLSARAINNIERGQTLRPHPHSVERLATALGLDEASAAQLRAAAREDDPAPDPGAVTVTGKPAGGNDLGDWQAESPLPLFGAPAGIACERRPSQLPPDIADFSGRRPQAAALTDWLQAAGPARCAEGRGFAPPVAVISGPPGIGKTALAVRVAHSLRTGYPGGQLFADLGGLLSPREPGEVLGELLRALGAAAAAYPVALNEMAALLRSLLADRRVLLVLDDAADPGQVRPLLPGTGDCAVIVTSRTRITGLGGARIMTLDPFTKTEAMDALSRMAGTGRVAAEPVAAGRLVRACGLWPLAIRVAGARLAAAPELAVARLADLVAGEQQRLDQLMAGDLAVRASITASYQALPATVQRAFRMLGLVRFEEIPEWVIAVLAGEGADSTAAAGVLLGNCLVSAAGADHSGRLRYRVHDLLRLYAAEQLSTCTDRNREQRESLAPILAGYTELASAAAPQLAAAPCPAEPPAVPPVLTAHAVQSLTSDPMAWFAAERKNIVELIRGACALGMHGEAARLAAACAPHQHLSDHADALIGSKRQMTEAIDADGPLSMMLHHMRPRIAAILDSYWPSSVTETGTQ